MVSKIGSGKTPLGGAQVYLESGVMLLRSQNVHFDGLRLDDAVFIDDETDAQMASTRVEADDVLLNITGASLGRCTVVPSGTPQANVNQHVCILRADRKRVVPRFLSAALQSMPVQRQIFGAENGSSREGLTFEQIGNLEIPLPDVAKQESIAQYLDLETGRLDGLVATKERWLELLVEKRHALVTRAVTRGLNPQIPLRDSGLPWLGQIPKHWEIKRLKWLFDGIVQGWSPQAEQRQACEDEWAVIKISAIKQGRFFESEHKALPPDCEPPIEMEIKPGQFLLTRGNTPELVADVCVVEQTRPKLTISDLVYRLDLKSSVIEPHFLKSCLLADIGRFQIEADARGSSQSMVKIQQDHISNWLIPLPPLDEQRAIAAHIATETAKLDGLRTATERTIALLKERRAALIAAAVTGRIDLQGVGCQISAMVQDGRPHRCV